MLKVEKRLACQKNPDRWFSEDCEEREAAIHACGACPAMSQCRDLALQTGEDLVGIWGGMTPKDRRRLGRVLRGAA